MNMAEEYIQNPEFFHALELEEQLAIVAELVYYCACRKIEELERAEKTRVDSCIPAQKWYAREKYWDNSQMNIKKLAELEALRLRRGI